jgi:hypothetical protein
MSLNDEEIVMNISSAAGFLINRAVKMAASLNQDSKGSASKSAVPSIPNKNLAQTADVANLSRNSSSAYRVSLSSSALQKVAMENLSA